MSIRALARDLTQAIEFWRGRRPCPRCHQRVTDLPTHVEWHTVRIEGRPRGPHPGPFAPPGFELMGTPDQVLAPRRLFQPPGAVDGMEDQP